MECMTRNPGADKSICASSASHSFAPKMPLAVALPLILCLLLMISGCSQAAASTPWGLDQLGAYFTGIFRSVVGPLFGFGPTANNTAASF